MLTKLLKAKIHRATVTDGATGRTFEVSAGDVISVYRNTPDSRSSSAKTPVA